MKKYLICICTALLLLAGCKADDKEKLKEDLVTVEKDVVSDVEKMDDIAKEDIEKAVSYIHENIDKAGNSEVAKNIVKATTYLENAAKKSGVTIQHELLDLAFKAKSYASNLYTAVEKEKDTILTEGKKDVEIVKTKLNEAKDSLIEEFHQLVAIIAE